MINKVILNLFIILVSVTFLTPVCATNPLETFNGTKYLADKISKTTTKESVLNKNINISFADKNVAFINYQLPHSSAATASSTSSCKLLQSIINEHKITLNNVTDRPTFDGIIKFSNSSKQRHNSSKLVNSSASLPPLLSSSPGTTAFGTGSTNFTSTVSSYFERVEMHQTLTHKKNEKFLLHRNKRYLLFPEGSSFQLVFDLIIPIVDYTNFAIMGITCAVAWELPSKPPSEIIENFRTKLNDGTFGHNRRNDSTHQPLEYISSLRTEQVTVEDKKRDRLSHYQQHQKLPPTTAATSGHKHILTNASKSTLLPPTNNYNFYNNYIQQEGIQQPIRKTTTVSYGRQPQKQQWGNNNFDAIDSTPSKILDANSKKEGLTFKSDFNSQKGQKTYDKDLHASKNWNSENWQPQNEQQFLQMKQFYSDVGDYWNKENWWERNKNRVEKHWQEKEPRWPQYQSNPPPIYTTPMFSRRTSRNRKILNKPPKHHIYPVFGKRRRRRSSAGHFQSHNDDVAKKLQDIHSREHLQTRQKLYGKIEKLYETRGQNGTACVLRALCETERMNLNAHYIETPQSFVMELLRSIFALPNSKDSLLHLDDRYADAVLLAHDVTKSCIKQYHDCEYSIAYET